MKPFTAETEHPDPAVRKRMLDVVAAARLPGTDDILVRGVLDPDAAVGRHAADILASRYPWLILDAVRTGPLSAGAIRGCRFGPAWLRLRSALDRLVADMPPRGRSPAARFARLPAILPDLALALSAAGRADEARRVNRFLRGERQHGGVGRQILFAPVYACNLRCPYCYVRAWDRRFPGQLSLEACRTALAWCRRQGVKRVIFGGGEPTVHRDFPELVDQVRRYGMTVSLTSNGLFPKRVRDCIRPPAIPEFICHVEQDILRHDARRAARLRRNLTAAQDAGVTVRMRYTLTARSDRAERRAMMDVAREFDIVTLNYGFAFRDTEGSNEFFAYDGAGAGSFDGLLNDFMDEAREVGVELHLSKPFPLCCVRPQTLRRVMQEGGLREACTAWRRGYSMNLTVNPDLTTLPCNAIGTAGPSLTQFRSFREAGRFHAAVLRPLYEHPWQPRCARCVLFLRGVCQGVCLAEHYALLAAAGKTKGPVA